MVADDPSGLVVLFEDEDMVAVSKPPYLRTTPVHRFCGKSLGSQVLGHLRQAGHDVLPYIVHRLDQSTSGVYLQAKTKTAAASLQEHWHGPMCSKEYLALVHKQERSPQLIVGESFIVDAPIGRAEDVADDIRRVVDHGPRGQSAQTRFIVLAIGNDAAVLSCTLLESGRCHQIRVHASHAGLPLVGDGLYGGCHDAAVVGIGRVALHAWRLRVRHPRTGDSLQIEAPLPDDMTACTKQHGINLAPLLVAVRGGCH